MGSVIIVRRFIKCHAFRRSVIRLLAYTGRCDIHPRPPSRHKDKRMSDLVIGQSLGPSIFQTECSTELAISDGDAARYLDITALYYVIHVFISHFLISKHGL